MSDVLKDGGVLLAICGGLLAAGLLGFGLGWSGGCSWAQWREQRRQARINAALDGKLREVTGPALYARTKGEPFTQVLRRHERDARRDRV